MDIEKPQRKHRRAQRRVRNLVQKDSRFTGHRHKPSVAYVRRRNKDIIDTGLDLGEN
jgi:hypothetical protein|tara:strand:+ start:234 stop:404 length:171 start_codon:yes stop_codon:yes gene_type:complete